MTKRPEPIKHSINIGVDVGEIATLLVRFACWIAGMNYEEDQHVISLKKAKIE